MTKLPMNRAFWILILAGMLCGCASAPRTEQTPLVASQYSTGFDAVRNVLSDYRFELERVDARHGIITTRPKPTAGLITPWDKEQTSTRQELEELVNQEFRTVRVEFQVPGEQVEEGKTLTPANTADADLTDLRMRSQPIQISVIVNMSRLHRPGRQPSTKSIRSSTYYSDPALVERGAAPTSLEELGRDEQLESRLLAAIEKELAHQSAAFPAAAPAEGAAPTPPSP